MLEPYPYWDSRQLGNTFLLQRRNLKTEAMLETNTSCISCLKKICSTVWKGKKKQSAMKIWNLSISSFTIQTSASWRFCNCSCFHECWQCKAGQRPELVSCSINCQQTGLLFSSMVRIQQSAQVMLHWDLWYCWLCQLVFYSVLAYMMRSQRDAHWLEALVAL